MIRLQPPAESTYSAAQREVHDDIESGPRGGVHGPLGIWLWRPEMAKRAQSLGEYCRYQSTLSPRLSELAILITGRCWAAEFEWQHHKQIAIGAGLDPAIVESLRLDKKPDFQNTDEQAVYEFAVELLQTRRVSAPTYQHTLDVLGKETLVDLVAVLGYYGFISMTINVFEVEADGPDELA
ncbi:MAG: carboxymuconolactone decarboxylase family protein [Granulosicoccus sp.]|nr:carboxymuconolactone decarboxylase family protein [Granulosicoccus sp.]